MPALVFKLYGTTCFLLGFKGLKCINYYTKT